MDQNYYEKISETISVIKRSYPFPLTPQADNFLPGFNCDSQKLTPSVEVQTGDIIGICIYNSRETSEIDMITFRPGGYRMMFEGADSARCDTGAMPDVVGDRLQQDSAPRTLHISAQMGTLNDNEILAVHYYYYPIFCVVPDLASNLTKISTTLTMTEAPSNILSTGEAETGNYYFGILDEYYGCNLKIFMVLQVNLEEPLSR